MTNATTTGSNLPPPAPRNLSERRPKSNWAQISAVVVTITLAILGWVFFSQRNESRNQDEGFVVSGAPAPRIDSLVDFGCIVSPPIFISYSLPRLKGSSHDEEFNATVDMQFLSMLKANDVDVSEIISGGTSLDDGPFEYGALRQPGCTVPTDGASYTSLFQKFDVTYLSAIYVSVIVRSGSQGYYSHEYGDLEGMVFDLREGREIGVSDVFQDSSGWQEAMAKAVCERSSADPNCISVVLPVVEERGRVAFSPTGLIFLFDDCEIEGCFADTVEVSFAWERLTDYLRSDFSLPEIVG